MNETFFILNKGEANKGDIIPSLSDVMAAKVMDFIKRAKITRGKVLLFGGVTQNQYLVRFIRERMPEIKFIISDQAPYFEAYGAALMARNSGCILHSLNNLFKHNKIQFKHFKSLKTAAGKVTYLPSKITKVIVGREYILGVDGNIFPPNLHNKLEIFMLNVLRFRGNEDVNTMVEK